MRLGAKGGGQSNHSGGIVAGARIECGDRLRHEQAAMAGYGHDGDAREGHVLVAMPVVEASLDLDFGVMARDLAPIGSLIQSAGRLWRRMGLRPASKRPVADPILTVLSPDPNRVENPQRLKGVLGQGACVCGQDDQRRTAPTLFGIGVIDAPDGRRALIESVHEPAPEDRANWRKGKREHLIPWPVSDDGGNGWGLRYDSERGRQFTSQFRAMQTAKPRFGCASGTFLSWLLLLLRASSDAPLNTWFRPETRCP